MTNEYEKLPSFRPGTLCAQDERPLHTLSAKTRRCVTVLQLHGFEVRYFSQNILHNVSI